MQDCPPAKRHRRAPGKENARGLRRSWGSKGPRSPRARRGTQPETGLPAAAALYAAPLHAAYSGFEAAAAAAQQEAHFHAAYYGFPGPYPGFLGHPLHAAYGPEAAQGLQMPMDWAELPDPAGPAGDAEPHLEQPWPLGAAPGGQQQEQEQQQQPPRAFPAISEESAGTQVMPDAQQARRDALSPANGR